MSKKSSAKQRTIHFEHNAMTHERMLDAGEDHDIPRRGATVAEFIINRFLKVHFSPEVREYLKTSGFATTWSLIEEVLIKELRRRGYGTKGKV